MASTPPQIAPGHALDLPPTLPVHINVRSSALALLCLMIFAGFLHWAQAVLIPITLSILISYALTPMVEFLERRARLPRALGAGVIFAAVIGAATWTVSMVQSEALNILEVIPKATQKFNGALNSSAAQRDGAVAKLQEAAGAIEKAANNPPDAKAAAVTPGKPVVDSAPFRFRDYLFAGTAGLMAGIGQLVVVVALVYFLLVAGDSFRRTLLRVSDATLTRKKITIQILEEIDTQIQRYLLVQFGTSVLLGVIAWIIFKIVGLEHAATWGFIGAVLHLIPYAGPAAFIVAVGLVAYVQFDTLQPMLIIVSALLIATNLIAMLLVPWLTERVASLNAVAVFLALLIWGWLWGIWGLLLGVPVVMAVKAVCDRVDNLQGISAFLGTNPK